MPAQAKGVLAEHGRLSMDAAFNRLRRYARDHNLRLSELAREIVETELAAADVLAVRGDTTPHPREAHRCTSEAPIYAGRGAARPGRTSSLDGGTSVPVRSESRSVTAPAGRGDRAAGLVSWCTCSTTAIPALDGQVIVVRVAGEVDLCTIDHLRTLLDSAVAQRPAHVIVDLGELGFCSAHGLAVLSEAGDTALGCGIGYAVAGASAALDRLWAVGWTAAQRPIGFSTAGAAVLAALAHQSARRTGPVGNPSM